MEASRRPVIAQVPPALSEEDIDTVTGMPAWHGSAHPSQWSDEQTEALPPATGPTAESTPAAEQTTASTQSIGFIGRYELKRGIGEGSLGAVWAAHDPQLGRAVAIKTLSVAVTADARPNFDAVFLEEARAATGLSHPYIANVHDAGISESQPYLVMELLKGRDLRQLRQEGWRPTPAQAAIVVRRVADALAYAHSKGVIHRDVQPSNIFMVGRTQPRLLGFGLARCLQQQELLADDSAGLGSPYYLAPEQWRHLPVDRRTDVYALGVVLYELLAGAKPFLGMTQTEIGEAVLHHRAPTAHEVNRTIPIALSAIAERAMQKSPDDRYRSARSMARDLRRWLEENAALEQAVEADSTPQYARRWLAAGAAAVLLVGGLWWLRVSGSKPAPAATLASAPAEVPAAAPKPPAPAASLESAHVATMAAAPAATAEVSTPPPIEIPAASSPAGQSPSPPTPALAATQDSKHAAAAPVAPTSVVASPPPSSHSATATVSRVSAPARPKPTRAEATKKAAAKASAKAASRSKAVAKAQALPAAPAASAAAPPAPPPTGVVQFAVSPWGQVEVDGRVQGVTPPLTQLTLSEGTHTITIRNTDLPPRSVTVTVSNGQPVTVRHRF